MKFIRIGFLTVIFFFNIFSNLSISYAQSSKKLTAEDLMFRSAEQEGMEEEFIVLLSMTACAYVTSYLWPSCKYMPTSLYYASSGGNMYLSGEALSLVSRYKSIDETKVGDNLTKGVDSSNQLKLALKLKKSLLQMKYSAQEKIKLQKSARASYNMASTYALYRYHKQKDYLDRCLSDVKGAVRRTSVIPTCSNCASTMKDSRQMLINRENNDFVPGPSINKYNFSEKIKSNIKDKMMSKCKNLLCLPGMKGAERSCNTYRYVYFYNLTYCDPKQLSTLGANFSDKGTLKITVDFITKKILPQAYAIQSWHKGLGIEDDKAAINEITRLRTNAARVTDNWISGPRGRALLFAAMEELAARSVEVTENIIKNLDADLAKLEPMLNKLGAKGTGKDGIVEELFGSGGMLLTADGSSLPCMYGDCKNRPSKYLWSRSAHIGEMGNEFSKLTQSMGKVSDGLAKPRVSKGILDEADRLGNSVARLNMKRKMIEKSLDNILKRRGKRPIQFDAYKKQFTNKILAGTRKAIRDSKKDPKSIFASIFGGIASAVKKFIGPSKKKDTSTVSAVAPQIETETVTPARYPRRSGIGRGYKYNIDINKDKYKSIWQIIHERYMKVAPTRLEIER